jgi:hypothetical protein
VGIHREQEVPPLGVAVHERSRAGALLRDEFGHEGGDGPDLATPRVRECVTHEVEKCRGGPLVVRPDLLQGGAVWPGSADGVA